MDKFMNYVFMVLIAGFFTAIIFYAAHVFFPIQENNCWTKYTEPALVDKNYNDPAVQAQEKAKQSEIDTCNTLYESTRKSQEMYKLILIGAINVLVLLVLIFLGLNFVSFGVFVGVLLSSMIAAISYYDSSSKIALVIIVILFIESLILLTRNLVDKKEDSKTANKKRK